MLKSAKAKGQRGSWFATVDGEILPCVHKHWVQGVMHHDPFERHAEENQAKIDELVDAVRRMQRVVLTDDKATFDGEGKVTRFERKGYIAVYGVEDVTYSRSDGLRFRLADRIRNLE